MELKKYDSMFKKHAEFGRDVWFAGGAWTWQGFAPMNDYSLRGMSLAMESVRKNNIENVLITVWGDNGKETSYFSVLPSLYAIRQFAEGNFDMDSIKAGFKATLGFDFDAWMKLDLPHVWSVNGKENEEWDCLNKIMFYCDPFLGWRDYEYNLLDPIPFATYAKTLIEAGKQAGEFEYIFDTMAKLCDYLEYKAPLGVLTRKAYKAGDKAELAKLLDNYTLTVKYLDIFLDAFRAEWFKENKAFGWEIHDIRVAGVRARILSCQARLKAYLDGELDTIEELDVDLLPAEDRTGFMYHMYKVSISPSEI